MKAVTIELLKREVGEGAEKVYKKVCEIGGFGDIGREFKDGLPPLDISGLSEAKQKQILELIGKKADLSEAEKLAKDNDRKTLLKLAKDEGLDGNSYTDELELAKAILEKRGKK